MQNQKNRQITAWVAIFAIVFVMLFSTIYISKHIDHNCSGADCPICATLEQCSNNLKTIGTILVFVVIGLFASVSLQKELQPELDVAFNCSLISQKVRMNN